MVNSHSLLYFYALQYAEFGLLSLDKRNKYAVCLYTFIMYDLGFG